MKSRHTLKAALCAAGFLTVAAPALAANSASIIMSPLGYVLEDLAPDDGIASELTWLSRKSEIVLMIDKDPLNPPGAGRLQKTATGTAEPGSVFLSESGSTASLSSAGGALGVKIPSGLGTQVEAMASEISEFTLTPHTRVRFFADAEAEIKLDPASAESKHLFRGVASIEQGGHDGSSWAVSLDRIFANNAQPSIFDTHRLEWSALNDSGESTVLSVNPRIRVVMDNMAVVPEPAALAQALAGIVPLAMAAGLRRRRLRTLRG